MPLPAIRQIERQLLPPRPRRAGPARIRARAQLKPLPNLHAGHDPQSELAGFSALFGMRRMIGRGQMSSWNMPCPSLTLALLLCLAPSCRPVSPWRRSVMRSRPCCARRPQGFVARSASRPGASTPTTSCRPASTWRPFCRPVRAPGVRSRSGSDAAHRRNGAFTYLRGSGSSPTTWSLPGAQRAPDARPENIARERGDVAALPGDVYRCGAGRRPPCRYAVAVGQPLRAGMLILPPVVRQRDQVRVVTTGAGFSVSNEGKASTTPPRARSSRSGWAADGSSVASPAPTAWSRSAAERFRRAPLNTCVLTPRDENALKFANHPAVRAAKP